MKIKSHWPLICGTFMAMYPMMTTPLLIGGVVTSARLTAEQAGWIGTISIGFVAIVSMLTPVLFHRKQGKGLRYSFAGLLMLGYFGFAVVENFAGCALSAVLIGVGSGGLLAIMAMRIAQTADPDRLYGLIYAVATAAFAALLLALPLIAERAGEHVMFLALGLSILLILPTLHWLDHIEASGEAKIAASPGGVGRKVMLVVLVMTIAFPLYGGVYGFCERKAVAIGLGAGAIGMILAAATVLTVVGSMLVMVVGTKPGRTLPTMVTMAVATAAYGLVLGAATVPAYIIGMMALGLMQMALNSYFFGLASALDPAGRVAAALQGYSLIPYALGAGLFGSLARGGDLSTLAAPAVVINIVAALILWPLLRSLDLGQQTPQALKAGAR